MRVASSSSQRATWNARCSSFSRAQQARREVDAPDDRLRLHGIELDVAVVGRAQHGEPRAQVARFVLEELEHLQAHAQAQIEVHARVGERVGLVLAQRVARTLLGHAERLVQRREIVVGLALQQGEIAALAIALARQPRERAHLALERVERGEELRVRRRGLAQHLLQLPDRRRRAQAALTVGRERHAALGGDRRRSEHERTDPGEHS